MAARNRKVPLKRRTSLVVILIFCIVLFFSGVVQFAFMDELYIYATQQSMVASAKRITEINFKKDDYKSILSDIEVNRDVYIEIYSPRETLFYTTDSNDIVYEPDENNTQAELKPRIMKIISHKELPDGSYFEMRQEHYTSSQYMVYGVFFGRNNGIEIYRSLDAVKSNSLTASWAFFVTTVALSFILITIALVYANSVINPLLIINEKAKRIINMDFGETCPPFKIKEIHELGENINSLSASLSDAMSELKSENRRLEMDIEMKRRMEKTMRSFMANVSHELKTPISIIQGYAEGMKVGIGCDSTEEFCDIITEEADKMNNLVCRLMEYLQYGTENYRVNKITFNIAQFITDCVDLRSYRIKEADAAVSVAIDEKLYGYGDTELLSNVFNNYLSNALSHLDYERKINITCRDMGAFCRISVFNTGKQIPGTDIENIWQSFYRADKSHSRAEGRFGLGLSIVAKLQELHGQKYGVINKENGVEFWFDIEKTNPPK
ncbi:MAG: HAMP domain-containing histidine kinase [Clostridia bacterium]|nr:HAMP domain-containing histidine kinase [Clostridia bacterium]